MVHTEEKRREETLQSAHTPLKAVLNLENLLQVGHDLVPLALARVKRQQRPPRRAAVPADLAQRVLGARDAALDEDPVGARDDGLQLRCCRRVRLARQRRDRVAVQLEAGFLGRARQVRARL